MLSLSGVFLGTVGLDSQIPTGDKTLCPEEHPRISQKKQKASGLAISPARTLSNLSKTLPQSEAFLTGSLLQPRCPTPV